MFDDDTVWTNHAKIVYARAGNDYNAARRVLIADRNNSAPGTASFAFGNAALKALERLYLDGELQ